DFLTLRERWGTFAGHTIAFVGDGNNVATSLVHAAMLVGLHVNMASPSGYELPRAVVERALRVRRHGAALRLYQDPVQAVNGADAVYTDVWTSMGQDAEYGERIRAFAGYQVNADLMRHADPSAVFMHCLPAHRGEEVSDEVFESRASIVFDQAENRLHAQKALLMMLIADRATAV